MKQKRKVNISLMLQCSLFAALMCILSPWTIPIGIVPMSLSLFAVVLTAVVLGWRKSVVAVFVYIMIGAVGLPVFSGWQSGLAVLAGPTGGYVWSYVAVCAIVGKCADMGFGRYMMFVIGFVSLIVCYMCGIVQYMAVTGATLMQAMTVCVYPFVVLDIIKIVVAVILGETIRRRLVNSGLLA